MEHFFSMFKKGQLPLFLSKSKTFLPGPMFLTHPGIKPFRRMYSVAVTSTPKAKSLLQHHPPHCPHNPFIMPVIIAQLDLNVNMFP